MKILLDINTPERALLSGRISRIVKSISLRTVTLQAYNMNELTVKELLIQWKQSSLEQHR